MNWIVTELSGEAAARGAASTAYPSSSFKPFLDWQLNEHLFDFAVMSNEGRSLVNRLLRLPAERLKLEVILGADNAEKARSRLETSARRGLRLLIATKSAADELTKFFAGYGYKKAGTAALGDGTDYDLLGSSNDAEVLNAIKLASRMNASMICCFGHDADPVYLVSRN